jgi:hypothetical protein
MTLTTHALAGGLVGAVAAENPAAAALFGFMSHFLLDAIPHWDYTLGSSHENNDDPLKNDINVKNPHFMTDLLKIGIDIVIGLAVVILIFYKNPFLLTGALIGAMFAILPDPLQFIYMKTKVEPFTIIQKFHIFISTKIKLQHRPILGISTQLAIVAVLIIASRSLL